MANRIGHIKAAAIAASIAIAGKAFQSFRLDKERQFEIMTRAGMTADNLEWMARAIRTIYHDSREQGIE